MFQRREQRYWSFAYLCGQLADLARKTIEPIVLTLLGAETKAVWALQRHISRSRWPASQMIENVQTLVGAWLGEANSELATRLPRSAWSPHIIKEAGKGPLAAEFAFLRLVSIEDELPGPRQWVILRRTLHQPPELKYYLSNAPVDC